MNAEEFFDLFIVELSLNSELAYHSKFVKKSTEARFKFRKNYFLERLEFLTENIDHISAAIWDCGCGFGTESFFLALNGHKVYANTLEFYYDYIPARIKYWEKFGNLDNLVFEYKDILEVDLANKFDYVFAKDTLHHLEPIEEGLQAISKSLKPGGKLIGVEENGSSIPVKFRNYLLRRNRKIIEVFDERLGRKYLVGNENARCVDLWIALMNTYGLIINLKSIEYTRIFTPLFYNFLKMETINKLEKEIWRRNEFLSNNFYFGLNFIAIKK